MNTYIYKIQEETGGSASRIRVVESGTVNGEKAERSDEKEGERGERQPRTLLDAVAITATLAGERAQVEAGVHGNHLGQDL